LTEDDIHALKQLESGEEISNWMGSEELADNIFRAAQTDSAMKRNKVQGKERANRTHFEVGHKVREFIITELEGTPPEELPTPEKSIRQLEQEEQFRLKHKDQLNLFEPPPEETR
jgi:DNA-damage-inducible protein D